MFGFSRATPLGVCVCVCVCVFVCLFLSKVCTVPLCGSFSDTVRVCAYVSACLKLLSSYSSQLKPINFAALLAITHTHACALSLPDTHKHKDMSRRAPADALLERRGFSSTTVEVTTFKVQTVLVNMAEKICSVRLHGGVAGRHISPICFRMFLWRDTAGREMTGKITDIISPSASTCIRQRAVIHRIRRCN